MSEELEALYEKLTFFFETRKVADLRMTLLDMEPADIALYAEDNLEDLRCEYETGSYNNVTKRIIGDLINKSKYANILEIGEVGAQVKHIAKTTMGSSYAINRRKH